MNLRPPGPHGVALLILLASLLCLTYCVFKRSRPWDFFCPSGTYHIPDQGTFEVPPGPPMYGYTFRHICLGQAWEPAVLHAVGRYLHHQGSAVDVGAHVGLLSVPMARSAAPFPVYAFEVDPKRFKALRRNLVLNNIRNVQAFRKLLTSEVAATLDLTGLALVKLDCDGCEGRALQALGPAVRRWQPVILIEMQPRWKGKLVQRLQALSYRCSLIPRQEWDYVCLSTSEAPPEPAKINETLQVVNGTPP